MTTFYLWPEQGVCLRHPVCFQIMPGHLQVVALNGQGKDVSREGLQSW